MNRNTVETETALDLELSDAVLVHDLHFVLPRRHNQTQRDLIYAALQCSESLLDRGIGVVVTAGRSAFVNTPRKRVRTDRRYSERSSCRSRAPRMARA